MERDLEERVEAYLDGALSPHDTRAFERELAASPELAQALGTALLVRDMLATLPPDAAPNGLEEKVIGLLGLDAEEEARAPATPQPARRMLPRLRAAVGAATLGVRAPAWALGGPLEGGRGAAVGLSQMRWALGPLVAGRAPRPPAPRKPLWRQALALAWR